MIQEIEDSRIPKGRIDLIGFGRLGLRIGIHLIQVHRGGPKEIGVFDGQKIDGGDVIFTMKGANIGEYKADFLNKLCTHDENFRKIISVCEDITPDNLDLIKGDVVAIQIAGGNTIPIAAKIIKHAHERGAKTISTAGIFGFGDETIEVKDISEFEDKWLHYSDEETKVKAYFGSVEKGLELFEKWKAGHELFENEKSKAFPKPYRFSN